MSVEPPRFEAMVQLARQEPAPSVDVVGRVARRLQSQTPRATADWPLWTSAGLSVAAAVTVVLVVIQQGAATDDPLATWLRPLVMVMQ